MALCLFTITEIYDLSLDYAHVLFPNRSHWNVSRNRSKQAGINTEGQGCIQTFLQGGAKTDSSWGNAQNMLFETCKGFAQLQKDCLALILLSTLFKRL